MKIEELIVWLMEFKKDYGNLRVVSPGFDETGFDDLKIGDAWIVIDGNNKTGGHSGGRHKESKITDPCAEHVITIDAV